MYGIPNMKLDKKEVVLRRIALMEKEGIKFICNANVGEKRRGADFPEEYDGRHLHRRHLAARSADRGPRAEGVHFAMEFLTANTKAVLNRRRRARAHQRERQDVVVIGGGDTGTVASAPRCATAAKACCKSKFSRSRRWIAQADNFRGRVAQGLQDGLRQEERPPKFGADPRILRHDREEVHR